LCRVRLQFNYATGSQTFRHIVRCCGAVGRRLTALQGLQSDGELQPGVKVLINGAAGGVGTFAVADCQIVRAEVTGVCSTKNLDLVRSLGADG